MELILFLILFNKCLRKRPRGWHANVMGEKERKKQIVLAQITKFEELDESDSLSLHGIDDWKHCQSSLYQIYL